MADEPTSAPPAEASAADTIIALEKEFLLQNYARHPLVAHKGKGCYLYDTTGKRYLDMIAGIGVNALGHAHARIVHIIREQAALLIHCSNLYYHEYQGPLAKKLVELSGLKRAFFCNSGTEAVEGALKMVRAHGRAINPEKIEIVSLDNSFHGRTLGALSITGQAKYRADFEPLLAGVRFVEANNAEALEQAVSERTAGIVLEGIQGEGGIFPMSADYLRKARALADKHNSLLVFDEIQCGVGRPGTYFSYQIAAPHVLPDILTVAKPLACGLPLGAIVSNEKAAAAIKSGMHGTTFGGGALACRVALEFFDILEELMPSIIQVGGVFRLELNELKRHFQFIKEVRGYGLMIGVELAIPGKDLVNDGIEQGILFNCTHENVLRFLPPYILTEQDVDKAIGLLKKIFTRVKYIA